MSWLGLAGIISCCALILVFGLMLFPSLPQEAQAVDFTDPPSGTTTTDPSTGTSVGINLPASIDFTSVTPTPDGATTTATADLTVTTTNSASYSLYLYSSDGDNSLRPKISSLANISKINATAGDVGLTLSSLEPNTWGYNLGTSVPDDDTTYSAIPTDNSTPIQTKDTSSTYAANDTYTLSFGAKVDTSIPSGNYSNTLAIAVIAKPAFVTIAFDGNGADDGNMASLQMLPGGQQVLPNNTFVRSGYIFNGWNTAANGNGTFYADGISYTAPADSEGQTITLYAQWLEAIYMQDLTISECQAKATDSPLIVVDARDNNTYAVRYINNNCWMAQNLRIGSGITLTPTDSNVSANYTIPFATLEGNSVSVTEGQVQDSGDPAIGYWYNYCAATAGTICQTPNTQHARYDICPAGWALPNYDTAYTLNFSQEYAAAFAPVFGGYYSGGQLLPAQSGNDAFVYWWTASYRHSTARTPIVARMNITSGVTQLETAMSYMMTLSLGFNVRCILERS